MVGTLRVRHHTGIAVAVLAAIVLSLLAAPVAAVTARWIVPAGTPLPTGSTVVGSFPVANALVVEGSTAPVNGVSYDTPLDLGSLDDDSVAATVGTGVAATRAPQVWDRGEYGEQAVVALIDTGVAPVEVLEGAVAGEINFSGDTGGDGYGHGTFLASLIAGRSNLAPGIAPGAGILSLKVGRNDGATDLGSVMSALQWLHGPGRNAGLRVATLALGVDSDSDAAHLLEQATNALGRAGILVVTAAGNEGANNLSSPATATGTFSVGSVNDNGTADRSDDAVSDFSGSGLDRDGVAQPDIVASGEAIVGTMPTGSVIAQNYPTAWIDQPNNLFRGSGTSMSTALVAGVAALASSARPDLDGAALEAALRAGNGQADAVSAVDAALAAPAGKEVNSPPWSQEPTSAGPGNGSQRSNGKAAEAEAQGLRWTGLRWTGLRWTGLRWTGLRWTGLRWTGLRWTGLRWTGLRWTENHWGDENWAFGKWAGLRWTHNGWVGAGADPEPAGLRWTGLRWTGLRWTGLRWTGLRWTMLEAPAT